MAKVKGLDRTGQGKHVRVDLTRFNLEMRNLTKKQLPVAIAMGLSSSALKAKKTMQKRLPARFKLHTEYVPNSISTWPYNKSTAKQEARKLSRFGDMHARVYFRSQKGGDRTTVKRSMEFLDDQELGTYKTPHGSNQNILVPSKHLLRKGIKTGTGKIRYRYSPKGIYDTIKAGGKTTRGKIGDPFVINDTIMARTGTWEYEPLYFKKPKTKQKNRLHMHETVRRSVKRTYKQDIKREVMKMKLIK
jgi:hypothetical protein